MFRPPALVLVAMVALAGCTGDDQVAAPVALASDAYPVINTFLVALEAGDAAALDPTVQNDAQIGGVLRSDAVAAELATHGGLRIDYATIVTNIGQNEPVDGEFRARVGDPDRFVTLSWAIEWQDGQWRVQLPPRQLSDARIG